jgi:Ca2+-binding EF-hand superfamily protein
VRVLEKTGMYYPQPTLKALFDEYDIDGNGELDYRELAYMLSGNANVLRQKPQQHQDHPER